MTPATGRRREPGKPVSRRDEHHSIHTLTEVHVRATTLGRAVWTAAALLTITSAAGAQSAGQPAAAPRMAPGDTNGPRRDSLMQAVLASIAGRERMPAESVFKNIKVMKQVPAGRLVRVMNLGYARSLGVSCDHCHVVGEWEKEDRPQKQIAREMRAMMDSINGGLLAKIQGLESDNPVVNCTTCHRGLTKPALDF